MLGENPGAFGLPELNLFAEDTLEDLWGQMSSMRQIQVHGLLRTVAQLYAGEQTVASIDMARRWLMRRLNGTTTADVYRELCDRIAPLRAVDKSPTYVAAAVNLARIREAFPDAHYVHLVRHPLTQGQSIINIAGGAMAVLNNSVDYDTDPPTVDPQILWYRVQCRISTFLENIPENRKILVRGEDLLQDPESHLVNLCRWLGLPYDAAALEAMLHPEHSPFACLGPLGAHLGNDMNFLMSPGFKRSKLPDAHLTGPLPWRTDGREFRHEVKKLAHRLGYH